MASQLLDEVTARAQSDSLEDAREICADGTYFTNNLRIRNHHTFFLQICTSGIITIQIFRFPLNFWQHFPEIKAKFVRKKS